MTTRRDTLSRYLTRADAIVRGADDSGEEADAFLEMLKPTSEFFRDSLVDSRL